MRIVRSVGMGLDEKALEAVRTWRFDPARKDGQAVAVQINVEVSFRLY
jgi:protein TonB